MTDSGEQWAPRSVDLVRVIRRSMRCSVFGLLGLAPFLLGTGFAYQAIRLGRAVNEDLQRPWDPPPVYLYWLAGTIAAALADRFTGVRGDVALCFALLALQTWHCWRSFNPAEDAPWNPGEGHLLCGLICAYAGLSVSVWTVVILVLTILKNISV